MHYLHFIKCFPQHCLHTVLKVHWNYFINKVFKSVNTFIIKAMLQKSTVMLGKPNIDRRLYSLVSWPQRGKCEVSQGLTGCHPLLNLITEANEIRGDSVINMMFSLVTSFLLYLLKKNCAALLANGRHEVPSKILIHEAKL